MFLYKLESKTEFGYDEFEAAIVAAETEDAARRTHPCVDSAWSRYRWNDDLGAWVNTIVASRGYHPYAWPAPQELECTRVGHADDGVPAGVILALFVPG